jgi:hypothetical protein
MSPPFHGATREQETVAARALRTGRIRPFGTFRCAPAVKGDLHRWSFARTSQLALTGKFQFASTCNLIAPAGVREGLIPVESSARERPLDSQSPGGNRRRTSAFGSQFRCISKEVVERLNGCACV